MPRTRIVSCSTHGTVAGTKRFPLRMATVFKWRSEEEMRVLGDMAQQRLAHWNHRRLEPGFPDDQDERAPAVDPEMFRLETQLLETLRSEVRSAVAAAPREASPFVKWFESLKSSGPGQHDPLFTWLAEEASMQEMRWYLEQEAAGEA